MYRVMKFDPFASARWMEVRRFADEWAARAYVQRFPNVNIRYEVWPV